MTGTRRRQLNFTVIRLLAMRLVWSLAHSRFATVCVWASPGLYLITSQPRSRSLSTTGRWYGRLQQLGRLSPVSATQSLSRSGSVMRSDQRDRFSVVSAAQSPSCSGSAVRPSQNDR